MGFSEIDGVLYWTVDGVLLKNGDSNVPVTGKDGNIAGDGPAAARYTEARLSKLAEDGMLQGIKKKNVDFMDNYDETLDEPVTLPAIFPNLLCNPNTGIGVAMACNWLPHNLGEVANAIFDFMDGKEPSYRYFVYFCIIIAEMQVMIYKTIL